MYSHSLFVFALRTNGISALVYTRVVVVLVVVVVVVGTDLARVSLFQNSAPPPVKTRLVGVKIFTGFFSIAIIHVYR